MVRCADLLLCNDLCVLAIKRLEDILKCGLVAPSTAFMTIPPLVPPAALDATTATTTTKATTTSTTTNTTTSATTTFSTPPSAAISSGSSTRLQTKGSPPVSFLVHSNEQTMKQRAISSSSSMHIFTPTPSSSSSLVSSISSSSSSSFSSISSLYPALFGAWIDIRHWALRKLLYCAKRCHTIQHYRMIAFNILIPIPHHSGINNNSSTSINSIHQFQPSTILTDLQRDVIFLSTCQRKINHSDDDNNNDTGNMIDGGDKGDINENTRGISGSSIDIVDIQASSSSSSSLLLAPLCSTILRLPLQYYFSFLIKTLFRSSIIGRMASDVDMDAVGGSDYSVGDGYCIGDGSGSSSSSQVQQTHDKENHHDNHDNDHDNDLNESISNEKLIQLKGYQILHDEWYPSSIYQCLAAIEATTYQLHITLDSRLPDRLQVDRLVVVYKLITSTTFMRSTSKATSTSSPLVPQVSTSSSSSSSSSPSTSSSFDDSLLISPDEIACEAVPSSSFSPSSSSSSSSQVFIYPGRHSYILSFIPKVIGDFCIDRLVIAIGTIRFELYTIPTINYRSHHSHHHSNSHTPPQSHPQSHPHSHHQIIIDDTYDNKDHYIGSDTTSTVYSKMLKSYFQTYPIIRVIPPPSNNIFIVDTYSTPLIYTDMIDDLYWSINLSDPSDILYNIKISINPTINESNYLIPTTTIETNNIDIGFIRIDSPLVHSRRKNKVISQSEKNDEDNAMLHAAAALVSLLQLNDDDDDDVVVGDVYSSKKSSSPTTKTTTTTTTTNNNSTTATVSSARKTTTTTTGSSGNSSKLRNGDNSVSSKNKNINDSSNNENINNHNNLHHHHHHHTTTTTTTSSSSSHQYNIEIFPSIDWEIYIDNTAYDISQLKSHQNTSAEFNPFAKGCNRIDIRVPLIIHTLLPSTISTNKTSTTTTTVATVTTTTTTTATNTNVNTSATASKSGSNNNNNNNRIKSNTSTDNYYYNKVNESTSSSSSTVHTRSSENTSSVTIHITGYIKRRDCIIPVKYSKDVNIHVGRAVDFHVDVSPVDDIDDDIHCDNRMFILQTMFRNISVIPLKIIGHCMSLHHHHHDDDDNYNVDTDGSSSSSSSSSSGSSSSSSSSSSSDEMIAVIEGPDEVPYLSSNDLLSIWGSKEQLIHDEDDNDHFEMIPGEEFGAGMKLHLQKMDLTWAGEKLSTMMVVVMMYLMMSTMMMMMMMMMCTC